MFTSAPILQIPVFNEWQFGHFTIYLVSFYRKRTSYLTSSLFSWFLDFTIYTRRRHWRHQKISRLTSRKTWKLFPSSFKHVLRVSSENLIQTNCYIRNIYAYKEFYYLPRRKTGIQVLFIYSICIRGRMVGVFLKIVERSKAMVRELTKKNCTVRYPCLI